MGRVTRTTIIFGEEEATGQAPVRGRLLEPGERILARENIQRHEQCRQAWGELEREQNALEHDLAAVREAHATRIDELTQTWERHLDEANTAGWSVLESVYRRQQAEAAANRARKVNDGRGELRP